MQLWLWAPYVGLPGPKRGTWLSCSVDADSGNYYCRTVDTHGNLLF
jgi:hypothetical protein